MNNQEFEEVFDGMVSTSRNLLVEKAKEYASDKDRLHNFKAAAGALDVTPELALRGMSTKHTISVNDMVKTPEKYTMEQWQEKIGDEFNYLILLMALVWERQNERADRTTDTCPDQIDGTDLSDVDIPEGLTVDDWYPHPFDFGAVLVKYTDGTNQTLRHRNADKWTEADLKRNEAAIFHPDMIDHQGEIAPDDEALEVVRAKLNSPHPTSGEFNPEHRGFSFAQLEQAKQFGFHKLGYLRDGGKPVLFRDHAFDEEKIIIRTTEDTDNMVPRNSINYHGATI